MALPSWAVNSATQLSLPVCDCHEPELAVFAPYYLRTTLEVRMLNIHSVSVYFDFHALS